MSSLFNPRDWYWVVAGDATQAWSSAASAFVPIDDAMPGRITRIAALADLDEVLRRMALVSPIVTATDVKAEARRRLIDLMGARDLTDCLVKQINAQARLAALINAKASRALTADEAQEVASLRLIANVVSAIRAASNRLEAMSPLPVNYRDDQWWQVEVADADIESVFEPALQALSAEVAELRAALIAMRPPETP
jgi:hypothetical protein